MTIDLSHVELGTGTPIIILHGLFGSKRNWGAVAKALSARHRVFALDLRNHGESPWDDDVGYEALAADVAAFIHRHALAPCTVIGHSMGGKTAMTLALKHAELVERLVVVDIAPASNSSSLHDFIKAMMAVPLAASQSRKDVEAHLAPVIKDVGVRQFLLQNLVRADDTFAWRLNLSALDAHMNTIHGFPTFAPGHSYKGPTTFITGANSTYVQPHHTAEIHRLFPSAILTPIPGAGHWVHAEAQEAFLAAVWGVLG